MAQPMLILTKSQLVRQFFCTHWTQNSFSLEIVTNSLPKPVEFFIGTKHGVSSEVVSREKKTELLVYR